MGADRSGTKLSLSKELIVCVCFFARFFFFFLWSENKYISIQFDISNKSPGNPQQICRKQRTNQMFNLPAEKLLLFGIVAQIPRNDYLWFYV